jgi:hypothetical protein
MNAPEPAAPDDGPDQPHPWREILSEHPPIEGRRFHVGDSVWTVIAIAPEYLETLGLAAGALLPNLEAGWLSFESGTERRRLAPIPYGWETLTADKLAELCTRATPGRPPRTP